MQLAIYKPLEGEDVRRKIAYDKERDICNRYTKERLQKWRTLDLYFVLGLDSMSNSYIPLDVLKFVYRKQTMKYHPDVSSYPKEALFAVQKAYKTLSDPIQRCRYDSVHFDDSIPEDREYEVMEFLDVFSKVFQRNAKFSNAQPVPSIGTKSSPKEEIWGFYKFWRSFTSWRSFEFLYEDDSIMSRSERRYAEKENRSRVEKRKKEDVLRIRRLTEIAIKRDPRINPKKNEEVSGIKNEPFADGWAPADVSLLVKLMKDIKAGQKKRFDTITRKFNTKSAEKRSSKEIFIKCSQLSRESN